LGWSAIPVFPALSSPLRWQFRWQIFGRGGGAMTAPFIICGWHTPDYRAWAFKLITGLDDRGIPHDIVEVPELPGSWEANTMPKPAHLLDAMRHISGAVACSSAY
jgi:hypothetical protein